MGINLFKSYSSRNKRIITIAIFFILGIIATSIGAMQTLTQQEATDINNELDQLRSNVTVQYIFGNNLFICLLMFIPVFGWIFGFIALYNTGVVIAAQSMTSAAHGVSPLLLFFTLFLFPFTWLEFISYSVGFAEGFWLHAPRHSEAYEQNHKFQKRTEKPFRAHDNSNVDASRRCSNRNGLDNGHRRVAQ